MTTASERIRGWKNALLSPFKKSQPRESEARRKLQQELFGFKKCGTHGFPHKPSSIAFDARLGLLAIGTKNGIIRVFGQAGVEFSAQHDAVCYGVKSVHFLENQARVFTVCDDNSVHLWEITEIPDSELQQLVHVREYKFELSDSNPVYITTCCLSTSGEEIFIGLENGNIFVLNVATFSVAEDVIRVESVMQNVPDDFKRSPGAVVCIAPHPQSPNKYLLGYQRGLMVIWNHEAMTAEKTYCTVTEGSDHSKELEYVCWYNDGSCFVSAHSDASLITWAVDDSSKPKEPGSVPYGPFPCKPINKVLYRTNQSGALTVFSGGMQRSSHGDKNTVSVHVGDRRVSFDCASKVLDFVVISNCDEVGKEKQVDYDDPHSLLILCEEELITIDLESEDWVEFQLPYLSSIHSCAVISSYHVADVPRDLWDALLLAGNEQRRTTPSYSSRSWPVAGGFQPCINEEFLSKELLLTGHEDGSVRFWDISGLNFRLLYKVDTGPLFGFDMGSRDDEEEDWPKFQKVGTFDPYSDDPRLGIQRIQLCTDSRTLAVAGTAGQVIVLKFEFESRQFSVPVRTVDIVGVDSLETPDAPGAGFVWKGHEAVTPSTGDVKYGAGFQPQVLLQLHPPASVSSFVLNPQWKLLAAGTAHGFTVFDYSAKDTVTARCTLTALDAQQAGESVLSRVKSLKKSLRQSFRSARRRRSQRRTASREKKKADEENKKLEETDKEAGDVPPPPPTTPPPTEDDEEKPQEAAGEASGSTKSPRIARSTSDKEPHNERKVEARGTISEEERPALVSLVRALYFTETYIQNGTSKVPSFMAGTDGGTVFIYTLNISLFDARESPVTATLVKEIQLHHKAPILALYVLDNLARPLVIAQPEVVTEEKPVNGNAEQPAEGLAEEIREGAEDVVEVVNEEQGDTKKEEKKVEIKEEKKKEVHDAHQLFVVSEEQFKIFNLPTLKPHHKFKLTAHEGTKVRKASIVEFRSRKDGRYVEYNLVVLSNNGAMSIFSVPQFKRQLSHPSIIKKEDIQALTSCIFSRYGLGFYQSSPSEFEHFSMSARVGIGYDGTVQWVDSDRVVLLDPPEPKEKISDDDKEHEDDKEVEEEKEQAEEKAAEEIEGAEVEAEIEAEVDAEAAAEGEPAGEENEGDASIPHDMTMDDIKEHTESNDQSESTPDEAPPADAGED